MLEIGCTAGVIRNLSNSEAQQGSVIQRFKESGTSPIVLPHEILKELQRVSEQVLQREATKDEDFAEIYQSQLDFMSTYAEWKSRAYLPRDF